MGSAGRGRTLAGWEPPPEPPHKILLGGGVKLRPIDVDAHARELFPAYADAPAIAVHLPSVGAVRRRGRTRRQSASTRRPARPGRCTRSKWATGYVASSAICGSSPARVRSRSVGSRFRRRSSGHAPQRSRCICWSEHAFDLGYRRVEWKCDALNAPSVRAAERLGFTYEGTFRQATHYRGRSRDTAWFSILDHEWPNLDTGFQNWFDPSNFDARGQQRSPLRVR